MDDPPDRVPEPAGRSEERSGDGGRRSDGADDRPTIRLDNVLKLAGVVETGGQAKRLVQGGEVKVNGAVETRRKHMLREGDEVEVDGETFVVELTTEDDLEDDMDDGSDGSDGSDAGDGGPPAGPTTKPGS